MLIFTPSRESERTASNSGSPRYRQLDVDAVVQVVMTRLRDHLGNIVGEHLERNMPVGHGGDQLAAIGGVVANAGLFQQRRVGGEAGDPGLPGHLHDLGLVGAVGEQLDREFGERRSSHGAHYLLMGSPAL
jgi:hypothetical protein